MNEIFRRLWLHVTLAYTVLVAVVIAIESFIPGFATPFIDLPFALLIACVLVGLAGWMEMSAVGRFSRVWRCAVFLVFAGGAWLAWSTSFPTTMLNVGLAASLVVVLVLVGFAGAGLFKNDDEGLR